MQNCWIAVFEMFGKKIRMQNSNGELLEMLLVSQTLPSLTSKVLEQL